jgi:hypothetical protein
VRQAMLLDAARTGDAPTVAVHRIGPVSGAVPAQLGLIDAATVWADKLSWW